MNEPWNARWNPLVFFKDTLPTVSKRNIETALHWKKPRIVAVQHSGDLFHESVDMYNILKIFGVMNDCQQHMFLVLTKRPQRALDFVWKYGLAPDETGMTGSGEIWPENVWLGVSVSNQSDADRLLPILLQIPAAKRWVSVELRGPINLVPWLWYPNPTGPPNDLLPSNLTSWVVCGGETGPRARPLHPDWGRSIRDQCREAGVPFWLKSMGEWDTIYDRDRDDPDWRNCPKARNNNERYVNLVGGHGFHNDRVVFMRRVGRKAAGCLIDGRKYREMPE